MSNKKRIWLITLLIIGLIVTITGGSIFIGIWFRPIKVIEISDNKDFTRKYHFPGKGTEENPYIIEGYTLSGNSHYNILIRDVSKYFIIRNCVLEGSNKGINLYHVENGFARIENNTIRNNEFGILIESCNNFIIKGNEFEDNSRGIETSIIGNGLIKDNLFLNSGDAGMFLSQDYNITIQNNIFNKCHNGFFIFDSVLVSIKGNTFSNCSRSSFEAQYINNINIRNNTAVDCEYGYNVVYSENVVFSKNNFTKTKDCIWASYSDKVVIEQNYCIASETEGISAFGISNGQIYNNTMVSNAEEGLYIWSSFQVEVYSNSCYNNTIGLKVLRSNVIDVTNNTFEHNLEYGVVTKGANTTIWNNNFINNDYTNISTINSQAKVDGNYTDYVGLPIWYNNNTQQGNYWSDLTWSLGVEYLIDPGNHTDKYPLELPVEIKIS